MTTASAADRPHRHSAPAPGTPRPFRLLQQRGRSPDPGNADPARPDDALPFYRSRIDAMFSAIHAVSTPTCHARPHGHDFTAGFVFEAIDLIEPGVVVDDHMRAEILRHVATRLDGRDLNALLGRPATCEVIAGSLLDWYIRSAPVPIHAHLAMIQITTVSGLHGEIHLPDPVKGRRR